MLANNDARIAYGLRCSVGKNDMAQEIREYLGSLIPSAPERSYVIPPDDASEKIANEIERRTKLKVQNLAQSNVQIIDLKVNAHVNHFVEDTLRAINDAVTSLESNSATAFEVKFANPVGDPTWDFGWAKLLVRYTS